MKRVKVTYTCDGGTETGGMIDAGPPPVEALFDSNKRLHLRGPKIRYTVDHVESFTVDEVDV